jgi:hypothetical protein
MTAPSQAQIDADSNVFPLFAAKSTESRLEHFDETVFKADSTTVIYKFIDAICGDGGAGSLKKSAFLDRLSSTLENIYFSDLDYIFGNIGFLSRHESESYVWDPSRDMLTSDQWDEVRVKDAWYRARIREFFMACGLGGTPEGYRMAVHAASSVDCDLYEVWRYKDNFGLRNALGRAPVTSRNEVVVTPHKSSLAPKEFRLMRDMLRKITPADVITTISTTGLSVNTPVPIKMAAADSSYFEVQKQVIGTPVLADLPAPELLAIDLRPSEQWLLKGSKETAPYAAFNITQESGFYYLVSGGARSPVDSVEYGTLQATGTVKKEPLFESFKSTGQYTPWVEYDLADSPDNYPGGKFGIHPNAAPALNPDQSAYIFPYESQQAYVESIKVQVTSRGGQADNLRFRLPITPETTTKKTYTADLAVAYNPPVRDSTVTSSWSSRENSASSTAAKTPQGANVL